jgi:hypothetical protein
MSLQRYVHLLLFSCLECHLPIAVALISNERSPEKVNAQTLNIRCRYCGWFADMLGVTAKKHSVEPWP